MHRWEFLLVMVVEYWHFFHNIIILHCNDVLKNLKQSQQKYNFHTILKEHEEEVLKTARVN